MKFDRSDLWLLIGFIVVMAIVICTPGAAAHLYEEKPFVAAR